MGREGKIRRVQYFVILLIVTFAIIGISFLQERYLPALMFMGFVDGLNVCSLSLMALLVSLMYNANVGRETILLLGFVYIASVFLSYFLLGLGILIFSISIPTAPHFLARISVAIMLFIGTLNILNYFSPGLVSLNLPATLGKKAINYMKVATIPSLFVAGTLVGVHNFPCACTAGIYLSFISLIANAPLYDVYLALYNFIFVMPLIVILFVCSSKPVTVRLRKYSIENIGKMKLVLGTLMILFGLLIVALIISGLV